MAEEKNKFLGMAEAAGTNAVGQVMGLVFGGLQDKRQLKQQARLNDLAEQSNKNMMDYQNQKALEMWKATNFGAQKEEMLKAGLNPALLYGMQGGGGTTTGGTQTGGISTANASRSSEAMAAQTQMGLMLAQTEALKAQANRDNAQANKLGGYEKDNTVQNTAESKQRVKNLEMLELKNEQEKRALEFKNKITESNIENLKNQVVYNVQKDLHEMNIAANRDYINTQTQQEEIAGIKARWMGAFIENQLNRAKIGLTEEEKKKIGYDITAMFTRLALEGRNLDQKGLEIEIQKFKETTAANNPNLWNVFGKGLNSAAEIWNTVQGLPPSGVWKYDQKTNEFKK